MLSPTAGLDTASSLTSTTPTQHLADLAICTDTAFIVNMSSVSHAGPDAMVTIKVTFEGVTRRAKMPLREMVPRVLEEHVSLLSTANSESKAESAFLFNACSPRPL